MRTSERERLELRADVVWAMHAYAREHAAAHIKPVDLPDEAIENIALANALLKVEHEALAEEFRQLERLLSLIPPGGEIGEIVFLPWPKMSPAMRSALALRWLSPPVL
jgi:hypothetical protein